MVVAQEMCALCAHFLNQNHQMKCKSARKKKKIESEKNMAK